MAYRARVEPLRIYNPDAVEVVGPYRSALKHDPCCYCGEPADTLDHIEPVGHGGDNHWSNLTAACRMCNQRKGARPLLTALLAFPLFTRRDEITAELRLLTP